jgi:N-acetylneuraminic acid mutarotase
VRRLIVAALCLAACGAPGAASAAARPDSWQPAGATTGRLLGTATTLADGRVLAAGGEIAQMRLGAAISAELFDPGSGTWTPTGALNTPRAGQTATLLRDGRVLIVGGGTGTSFSGLASAEVYDPSSGRFTPTAGAPTAAHSAAVAEPLPDGRVLIAGGFGADGAATPATDIYDPATDAFTAGPPLGTARAQAVAAVVAGGRVLVAGGTDAGGRALASAEIYDAASDAWTPVADALSDARVAAAVAPLPGGRALVAGGVSDGRVPLASADVYDPAANRFAPAAPMRTGRQLAIAAPLPGGRVLVAGGATGIDTGTGVPVVSSAEVYDPAVDTWTSAATLSAPRAGAAAAVLGDGDVLVAGGVSNGSGSTVGSAERYISEKVPAAPEDVEASAGDGSAAVTWAPPQSDGGAPVRHYVVTARPGGSHATTADGRTFAVVGGLTNGTAYTFTVHAVNAIGDGPESAASAPVAPAAATPAPAAPAPHPAARPHVRLRGLPRRVTSAQLARGLRFTVVSSAPLRTVATLTARRRVLARRELRLKARAQTIRLVARRLPPLRRFHATLAIAGVKRTLLVTAAARRARTSSVGLVPRG